MSDNEAGGPPGELSLPSRVFSRRRLLETGTLAVGGAALAAGQRANAEQPENVTAGERGASASDPGPENQTLRDLNPNSFMPPPTDHGLPQIFWSSFSGMRRHIQEGGWSRQVNVHDFPISKEIAGVNMRLTAGGIRELHWHKANEWALMLTGNCRLTALNFDGSPYVNDVTAGDLWYFPTGVPHSLQGLGPDGCEFLLVFDEGGFSEEDTTLLTDWAIHTPPEVLAKNWGVTNDALDPLKSIPREGRYIFQAPVPPPLGQDKQAVSRDRAATTAFDFRMMLMQPQKSSKGGEVRIVDSTNFPAAANIAMAHVTLKPGALRELHWHPNADEWQYFIQGAGRMTVFFNRSVARTIDFRSGDVGYVPQTLGHYIENTGNTDLVFLEMFKAPRYQDFSLNDWLTHLPPELVIDHLGISQQTLGAIPRANDAVLPV
jgi:oxalate decarboxylase